MRSAKCGASTRALPTASRANASRSSGASSRRRARHRRVPAGRDRICIRLYGAERERIATVPCGVDLDEFAPGRPRRRPPRRSASAHHEFVVLQLGRMVPRKGVDNVIRAVAQLRDSQRARLLVVGGDAAPAGARCRVRRDAAPCRCSPSAAASPTASPSPATASASELAAYYAACDVFVTTPWYEPFGITPLEAMASARPVIGSAVGGIRYSVVDGVTGFLVPPRDPARARRSTRPPASRPARSRARWAAPARAACARASPGTVSPRSSRRSTRACSPKRRRRRGPAPRLPGRRRRSRRGARREGGGLAGASAGAESGRDSALLGAGRAVFVDKDGTLVEDVPYNVDPARLRFTPAALVGAAGARRCRLRAHRRHQPAGARDRPLHAARIRRARGGAAAARSRGERRRDRALYCCPHAPSPRRHASAACAASPRPGMLRQAARAHRLDLRAVLDGRRHPRRRRGRPSCRLPRGAARRRQRDRVEALADPLAGGALRRSRRGGPLHPLARSRSRWRRERVASHGVERGADALRRRAWHGVRRLLVVRLDNLGDVLMATPAIAALRAGPAPTREITLLASPSGAAAVRLPRRCRRRDRLRRAVGPGRRRRRAARSAPSSSWSSAFARRASTPPSSSPSAPRARCRRRWRCRLAGIPLRLAHCRENPYGLLSDWVAGTRRDRRRHAPRGRAPARAGRPASASPTADRRLRFSVPATARSAVAARLARAGVDPRRPLRRRPSRRERGVAPLSGGALRRRRRPDRARAAVRPSSSPAPPTSAPLIDELRAAMTAPAISLAGQLDLGELAALIEARRRARRQQQRPGAPRRGARHAGGRSLRADQSAAHAVAGAGARAQPRRAVPQLPEEPLPAGPSRLPAPGRARGRRRRRDRAAARRACARRRGVASLAESLR